MVATAVNCMKSRKLCKPRRTCLRLITAQAEDYMQGRNDDGKTHDAADTARYAVELLEASRIFNAGIGEAFPARR